MLRETRPASQALRPPDAPLHGDWIGGRINGHTVIVRLMRDPRHRSDQWAAEVDGEVIADAAGLTELWRLLHRRWPRALAAGAVAARDCWDANVRVMMTDRELLEMAAKAAGIVIHRGSGWQSNMLFMPTVGDGTVTGVQWDPLDGDALRLAVKLNMDIFVRSAGLSAEAVAPLGHAGKVQHKGDAYAATRRAIVRAAAAMVGE